jgi:hypothetical protein
MVVAAAWETVVGIGVGTGVATGAGTSEVCGSTVAGTAGFSEIAFSRAGFSAAEAS